MIRLFTNAEGEAPIYATWDDQRRATLEHARLRPAMYVGGPENAHLTGIETTMQLMWMARAFSRPQRCRVTLSPTQFLVVGEAGPMVRAIQTMHSWGENRVLSESWQNERRAYFGALRETDRDDGRRLGDHRWNRRWRYTFSGPIGPRLESASDHAILARRFAWGLRTAGGVWGETYTEGWPDARPFLIEAPSLASIVVAGELDPQWFSGLPFDQEDVVALRALTGQRKRIKWSNIPSFRYGEVVAAWRDENFLRDEDFSEDGMRRMLEAEA